MVDPVWWRYTELSVEIFFVWLALAGLFGWVGLDTARTIEGFQVIPESSSPARKELVVLRVYGDYLITAPLVKPVTEADNLIERELYILKLSEMSETPLVYKNVGPLKVKQEDS